MCEICSKYTRKTPEQLCCVLVSDFNHIPHGLLVFPLFMLNKKYRLELYHRDMLSLKLTTLILGGMCPGILCKIVVQPPKNISFCLP